LTKFRARLLLHKKDGIALENTLRLAQELGLLDGPLEQIVDSTPMLGAAATQDTVRLVRFGVRKLIDAVKAADLEASEALAGGLVFDYRQPGVKPDCQWRLKAERDRMLTRVAQDAQRALLAVEQADGLLDDEQVKTAYELLSELIGQDFDVDQDGVPRLHRGTRPRRIISTVDPEMQHGRKSSQSRFDGYKLSAAVTNSSDPLIMAVHVAPGGESDGPQAKHLIDAQPSERRPERILGDTAYGNGVVRAELAERDVEVLAPVPEGAVMEDRVGKRDFTIDPAGGTVTCPAGNTAMITTSKKGVRTARISRALCGACPLKDQCCPGRPSRQIALGEHEELMIAARQALADPDTAKHLRHTRPRIERLLGLLACRYGARKSRYIGTPKATLQASWAAALVNLNPIGRQLAIAAD
ncbi:MAG TPA: transposase, partial [Solirubrobacteraceae bacterium]|nr:transposase [Solirubrobacteraceae bacterium]